METKKQEDGDFWKREETFKRKVLEANRECVELIYNKAKEAGAKNDREVWLFAGRVHNLLFTKFYTPCIEATKGDN